MNKNMEYFELENKYIQLKDSFKIVMLLLTVFLLLIAIALFSNTEIIIEYDGGIWLYETKYWGIVETYKEVRYVNDNWEVKINDSWEELNLEEPISDMEP